MALRIFGVALFLSTLFVGTLCQTPKVRMCVPKSLSEDCKAMEAEIPTNFTCVTREDRFDCMRAVHEGEADITKADAQGIYIAGGFSLDVLAFEENDGLPYMYKGVALVKKSLQLSSLSNLRGKRSCHTGVHRTVGWQVPITILQSKGIMTPNCEGELATVADFFNKSCAAHEWSPDPIVDAELKKKYPSLCELCDNPATCTRGDLYAGYEGALRCLTEDRGDIAFSKTSVVQAFLDANNDQVDQLDFICLNESRIPASYGVEAACGWGTRPSNAFVYKSSGQTDEDKQRIFGALLSAFIRHNQTIRPNRNAPPEWYSKVLISSSHVTNLLRATEEQSNWENYLGDFRLTIDRYFGDCQPKVAKFCTTSAEEQSKCSDLSKAAYARRSNVKLECVQETDRSTCIQKIKDGSADLITLDGGDIYKAGRYSSLVPVAAEFYDEKNAAKYYAVAVIPASSSETTLADFRNKTSCHTGIGRTAGWVIPVSSMVNAGLIPRNECDRPLAVSQFFSASCAPGANDSKYNPNLSGVQKLCQRCIGDESNQHKCSRGSNERYSGYAGAFRCLVEGGGDIAFVKHTTATEYTNGNSDLPWTNGLKSEDYKLLCPDGRTAQVTDYENCSLARVPSHHVMTSGSSTTEQRLQRAEFLALVSKFLGKTSPNFNAFKEYEGKSDLLFKDSTTSIRAVNLDSTYKEALGTPYYQAAELSDPQTCGQ